MMKKVSIIWICIFAIYGISLAQKNDLPTLIETFESTDNNEHFFEQYEKSRFYFTEVFIQDFDTEPTLSDNETRSWDTDTYIPILEQQPTIGSVLVKESPFPCSEEPSELIKIQQYLYTSATEYSTITIHKSTPNAKKTIKGIQKELDGDANFNIMAAKHSEDAYKDNGGRFPRPRVEGSDLNDQLDKILENKEGSIKLMETEDAFVLVKVDAHVQVPIGVYALRFPLDIEAPTLIKCEYCASCIEKTKKECNQCGAPLED